MLSDELKKEAARIAKRLADSPDYRMRFAMKARAYREEFLAEVFAIVEGRK